MASLHDQLGFEVSALKLGRFAYSVSVRGELDLHTAPQVRDRLASLPHEVRHVLVDLTGLEFIDSLGLTALLSAARKLQSRGGEMMLVVDDARIRRILEVTGIDRYFELRSSADDAARELVGASLLESL